MQIMRDPDSGNSRGFGFISYDSFEASDSAIEVLGLHCIHRCCCQVFNQRSLRPPLDRRYNPFLYEVLMY